jgi:murein DD-endopeptidase MepM/ murein hydrolase activator NlpD
MTAQRAYRISVLLAVFISLGACSSVGGFKAHNSSPRQPVYHVINKGETLLGISNRYQTSPDQILLLNGLRNARVLNAGYRLLVGYHSEMSGAQLTQASVRSPAPPASSQGGRGEYVEYQGGRLLWPLGQPARIVSKFGPRGRSFHDGLDIAAPPGTSILAAHSGIVAYSGSELRGYGNLIVMKGDDDLITVYAHNRRNHVKKGDRVKRGQRIAEVGATGRAQGPHLHFEVRSQDQKGRAVAVDPLPLLKPDRGQKPGFRINESLRPLLAWLDKKQ